MSDLTPDQLHAVAGILWSYHGEQLRSILTGILRRTLDDTADSVGTQLADGLVEPLAAGNARGFFVPPVGLRYFWNCGTSALAVIEESPHCRTLSFNQSFVKAHSNRNWRGPESGTFHLAFPYVVFVFTQDVDRLRELRVFFRTRHWERLDNSLLIPCLPNIHTSCDACLHDYQSTRQNPLEAATDMIGYFWQGSRTNELCDGYNKVAAQLPIVRVLDRWEQRSSRQPLFIVNEYPQLRSDVTVAKLLYDVQTEAVTAELDPKPWW